MAWYGAQTAVVLAFITMIEALHRVGSRIRNSEFLRGQTWLWSAVEPVWQRAFGLMSRDSGYATHINTDVFKLEYAYGSRYDRRDKRAYETSFYMPFVERISEGMTVLDIGAHVGIFSLGAARRVGRSGRVVAFEPSPQTIAILRRHVAFNRMEGIIHVEEAVVSDSTAPVSFFVYEDSMAASMSRKNVEDLNPEARRTPASEIRVPSFTLDGYCSERSLTPQVLKIDVEGAEHGVLLGARGLMAKHDLVILCEVHPRHMANCGGDPAAFYALIDELGYDVTALDEPNPMGIYHSLITKRRGAAAPHGHGAAASH